MGTRTVSVKWPQARQVSLLRVGQAVDDRRLYPSDVVAALQALQHPNEFDGGPSSHDVHVWSDDQPRPGVQGWIESTETVPRLSFERDFAADVAALLQSMVKDYAEVKRADGSIWLLSHDNLHSLVPTRICLW